MSRAKIISQYKKQIEYTRWFNISLNSINGIKTHGRHTRLTKKSWEKIMIHYILDSNSFPSKTPDIYVGLIKFVSNATGVTPLEVKKILEDSCSKMRVDEEIEFPEVTTKGTKDIKINSISIGELKDLPVTLKIRKIIEQSEGVDKKLVSMYLRYYMVNASSSYSWSVLPKVYSDFAKLNKLPTIECFASPFNHTHNVFCSMFSADINLSYPKGIECKGNFFDYIKMLKGPNKFLFNPPYTDLIIDRSIKLLLDYMASETGKGSEFIALLPDWYKNSESIRNLCHSPNSAHVVLRPQSYYLYDFSTRENVKPGNLSLILVVNSGSSSDTSQEILEQCVETMAV